MMDATTAQRSKPASSGNSEPKVTGAARAARKGNGVAFPQPRVEVRSASTLGIYIIRYSNSVGVAISRRRYTQSYYFHQPIFDNYPAMGNAYG